MEVREATRRDAEAVRAVHAESIRGLGPDAYDEEQVAAWVEGCGSADYAAAIEADDRAFVVAADDGVVVGFGSIAFEAPDGSADADAEVTAVYVHPSVARQGVGSAILADLERRARARGVRSLGLSASRNAVPFYESHGYVRVRERVHEFSRTSSTGVEGTVVEMRTDL